MPDLLHMLIDHDPAMLKIIAGKWGLALESSSQLKAAKELALLMLMPGEVERILVSLPVEGGRCMAALRKEGGRLPWQDFLRRYGSIREMGIARREREAPHVTPLSVAELLWYHGLVGRAFFDEGGELMEFAFIPDELGDLAPAPTNDGPVSQVSPIDQKLLQFIHLADDRILDHLTSYLAAARSGLDPQDLVDEYKQPSIAECEQLLKCCGLLDNEGHPIPDAVKSHLARPRGEALSLLFTAWSSSPTFNELRMIPGIILEGLWKNDPLKTRRAIMEEVRALSGSSWWTIDSFISYIKTTRPDLQRSAGDFDSWMIRSRKNGSSLRGYENWDRVDGTLIRYFLQGPLHWLGYLDLATSRKGTPAEAFRLSRLAVDLDHHRPPDGLSDEPGHLTALRNGTLTCPRDVPRSVRYLLARFCERGGINDKGYLYRITSRSLKMATNQGLHTEQLVTLLSRHCGGALPASLATALQRYARHGSQTAFQQVAILRVASTEIMSEIRNSPVGRFLGESLSPTTVVLPATAIEKILPRLMELGYVCDLDEGTLHDKPDKG